MGRLYPAISDEDPTITDDHPLTPTVPMVEIPPEGVAHAHRLQYIGEIQRQLESERDLRRALYKKYRRGVLAELL